jgi:hypothetical protein
MNRKVDIPKRLLERSNRIFRGSFFTRLDVEVLSFDFERTTLIELAVYIGHYNESQALLMLSFSSV